MAKKVNFFSNNAETNEKNSNQHLQSRYYRNSYSQIKNSILNYAKEKKLNPTNIDDIHKEILLQGKNYHLIITILQITPLETSVDIKVEYYAIFGYNRPIKRIVEIQEYLDKKLQFKGVGLHP